MSLGKKNLFVRSGGGFPGIDIHLGIWKAMENAGISATHCHGTSAGAVVSALDAAGKSAKAAELIVREASDFLLRAPRFLWKLRAFWIDHFLKIQPIAKWLDVHMPARFEELVKGLAVYGTRERDGLSWQFSTGWVQEALLASLAIPGVFPRVMIKGEYFSDGGTTANLPLPSNWMDYDEVYLLVASRPLAYREREPDVVGRLLHAVDLMGEDQINDVVATVAPFTYMEKFAAHLRGDGPPVFFIRPSVKPKRGGLRFDHDLIDKAEEQARFDLADQLAVLINARNKI
jgi:predicted patatin/cPLA2 family phospholipase